MSNRRAARPQRPRVRAGINADRATIHIGTVTDMTTIGDERPAIVTCAHCRQRYAVEIAPQYLCSGCNTLHSAADVRMVCSACTHEVHLIPEWTT